MRAGGVVLLPYYCSISSCSKRVFFCDCDYAAAHCTSMYRGCLLPGFRARTYADIQVGSCMSSAEQRTTFIHSFIRSGDLPSAVSRSPVLHPHPSRGGAGEAAPVGC